MTNPFEMRLTLRLDATTSSDREGPGKPFFVEIEDEKGERKEIAVFIANPDSIQGLGEAREEGIYLRRGIRLALAPIILQKIYYQSRGYPDQDTTAAALLYGRKVLSSEDLGELMTLLGQGTMALAPLAGSEGSTEYYVNCFSGYAHNYGRNMWVATARSMHNAGVSDMAMELGRGVFAAKRILEEGPLFGTNPDGKKTQIAPALKDILPEIVGGLESLSQALRDQQDTAFIGVSDVALIRALYFFTEEFINHSPVIFRDEDTPRGKQESIIEFKVGSVRLIQSALNHLRVDLTREHATVQHVLTSAKKVYGELAHGTSYKGLLGAGKGMTPEEIRIVVTEMEKLGKLKDHLGSSIVGIRKKTRAV